MIGSMGTDHNPIAGISAIPCTGVRNCNTPTMGIKDVLSANLKALMAARPSLDTLPKITKHTDGRLSNGKLDRIRRAAVATDIDSIEELARAFDVPPWQLLQDPTDGIQAATPINTRVKRWPFTAIDPEKVGNLSDDDAADLERAWLRVAKNLEIDVETASGKRKRA